MLTRMHQHMPHLHPMSMNFKEWQILIVSIEVKIVVVLGAGLGNTNWKEAGDSLLESWQCLHLCLGGAPIS